MHQDQVNPEGSSSKQSAAVVAQISANIQRRSSSPLKTNDQILDNLQDYDPEDEDYIYEIDNEEE